MHPYYVCNIKGYGYGQNGVMCHEGQLTIDITRMRDRKLGLQDHRTRSCAGADVLFFKTPKMKGCCLQTQFEIKLTPVDKHVRTGCVFMYSECQENSSKVVFKPSNSKAKKQNKKQNNNKNHPSIIKHQTSCSQN